MSFDVYAEVTNKIVSMLEAGVIPWRSPILSRAKAGWPKNLDSGREYRGVNVFLLAFTAWAQGYESADWLTYRQAQGRGGNVKRGEKSSMVVFWKSYETTDKKSGEPVTVPVLRYYKVFNVEQCEGIAAPNPPVPAAEQPKPFTPIEAAEAIARDYPAGPKVEHTGGRAYYLPHTDVVRLPEPSRFVSPEAYYATFFHELSHHADSGIMPRPA